MTDKKPFYRRVFDALIESRARRAEQYLEDYRRSYLDKRIGND